MGVGNADGLPYVFVPLCSGEAVRSIWITDSDEWDGEGPVMWHLSAARPTPRVARFVLGEVPDGFRELRALDPESIEREVTVWVTTTKRITFAAAADFRQVGDGDLYGDLEPVSVEQLRESRRCRG